MKTHDWDTVSKIHAEGIATGFATFETDVPSYESWDAAHLKTCRFVADSNGEIIGWAALSPVSSRCVYGGVAEVSVYIGQKSRGMGLGELLMNRLISTSETEGIWTLQSGIFPENKGSIKLHEKVGFRYIENANGLANWQENGRIIFCLSAGVVQLESIRILSP